MRTTPKTQEQLDQERMLPAGEYDFTIDKAEDKVSKKAREAGFADPDMIELTLTVFTPVGDRRFRDWVMDKMPHKLRHFAYAVGVGAQYESGALDAQGLVGRSGRLFLKQGKAQGDFPARNEVADYVPVDLKPKPAAAPLPPPVAAPRPVRVVSPADGTDDPPF